MIIEESASDQAGSCGMVAGQARTLTSCNQAHIACSEGFYKEQLVTELKNTHASQHERARMLAFLQKLEDSDAGDRSSALAAKDDDDDDNDGTDGVADLAARLGDLDLDAASFDAIWNRLTAKERQDFERIVEQDSEERATLLRQLSSYCPWWDMPKTRLVVIEEEEEGEEEEGEEEEAAGSLGLRGANTAKADAVAAWPSPLQDLPPLTTISKRIPDSSLLFNVVAVLYGYVFTNRYLNGAIGEDAAESAAILMDVAPLLTTKQSTTFACMNEAISYARQHLAKPANANRGAGSKLRQRAFLASKKVYFYAVYISWLKANDHGGVLLTRATDGDGGAASS
ncbi:hypothetical protein SYNPS1DRAFT_27546 [Syncephalis pseudoplumigaleata]|uniref:Uncharacterized protein n=1 Tax=Syncephalis pseudoplumigaleata TaxID=1712513 RepID=A0A4P9Z403_9FUNG|nr:hypothetical protein SYNPS1DRAFT_27546 [Syncephalis pseudoplumigaleata]|eukprot:RKP26772.1 hypothetical protein SYNPS1DRAFT_27546 [Syncephalis pseudoplumigaleata]